MNVVIMAAGKGTRMKSAKPKVLHEIGGRSLLQHVLATASGVGASRTVVVTGHGADAVGPVAEAAGARCVLQMPQLGTGHAMQQAVPALDGAQPATLVLYGDVPLLRADTARALAAACGGERLALLTFRPADPARYGRIVRDAQGRVRAIVEYKDASPEQRAIGEVYSGIMAAPTAALTRWVAALRNDNAQGEYYLTDVPKLLLADGARVEVIDAVPPEDILSINTPEELSRVDGIGLVRGQIDVRRAELRKHDVNAARVIGGKLPRPVPLHQVHANRGRARIRIEREALHQRRRGRAVRRGHAVEPSARRSVCRATLLIAA